jgi:hypothetical protein
MAGWHVPCPSINRAMLHCDRIDVNDTDLNSFFLFILDLNYPDCNHLDLNDCGVNDTDLKDGSANPFSLIILDLKDRTAP